ncbi:hypothetical protein C6N75_18560, partial [Streptomyces solincola]
TAYALVRLPESVSAADYGLHPALLDAALHALAALDAPQDTERDGVLLPFAWSGVECRAVGGSTLRVRIDLDDSRRSARLWAADAQGAPVARVRGLELREATRDQIRVAERLEHLYAVEFRPLAPTDDQPGGTTWVLGSPALAAGADTPAFAHLDVLLAHLDAGHPAPDRLLVDATSHPDAVRETDADAVREAARAALTGARRLLGEPRLAGAELVWVTRDSVAAADGDRLDGVAQAAVWGLVRAVRAEHPDRPVRLVDLDAGPADRPAVRRALAASGEPETAVRGDAVLAARLAPITRQETAAPVAALDAGGTVLVTGGTGDLGLRLARHLVREHGVRHLVLSSRRGPDAPGADAAVRELTAAGAAAVRVTACDTADRAALARVVADIDPAHPLTGVFHLAGVVDDGLLADQDADRLDRVLAPKAAGAVHLSELTADLGGCALVLFSSASGVLGGPGQSTYAAANAFLDALAARLRATGRPATSLSWGMWEQRQGTGMAAGLGQADVARMRRQGIGALTEAQGLRALDAALAGTRAHLVPIRLEPAVLQRAVDQGTDPAALGGLLRGLVRPRPRRAADGPAGEATGLRARLAALPADERKRTLLRLVRTESAAVLGGSGPDSIGEQQVFTVYGMDSMTSVELRRRLAAETGLSLPATLAFDHPTPLAVTELILDRLALSEAPAQPAAAPLAAARHTADEPVAVVAMACKLPGGIDTPERFWDLLAAGRDAIGGFPERWDALDVYDPDPEAVGKSYSRHGGFLHRAEHFDAAFFGISPREAVSMDPQQRLVLEASWEALERAGLTAEALSESRTGVYLGTMGSDYGNQGDLDSLDGYFGTGNAASVLSGRVSYALGLQGPAMTVDTACSSSLVSLHLAAQALRGGECELALAGGVTVMSTPTPFVEFSRLKGLAADGRCKPFSAASDGTGWSEGVGVLVLKRLSDAQRDGDRVLAVIRGSAVNQDGRSQGLTAPNGPSQQRVVRDALAAARLSAGDIDAIEAHGTGTSLGDPIEAGALAEVFGPDRPADRPLYLGSLKSNIGHTQAAAGVAGVIKMILALEHEKLPRTLHAEQPSTLIDWDGSGLELLQEARDWQRDADRPRRAGVSSFGLSGTNAHVVLEEAPVRDTEPSEAPDGPYPVVVSAQTEPALRAQAAAWADWLERAPQTPLADVARTAARHRTHFEQRAAITAATAQEAAALLRAVAGGDPNHPDVSLDTTTDGDLAVLFTGQGAQRLGMGRGLYGAFPVFAAAFDAVLEALGGGLREVVWGEDVERLNRTEYAQPALFAVEVALFRLWESWGVRPRVVAGHSVGEIAAAHVAGVLSLADAARLVVARGRLMQGCEPGGVMASVEASESEVLEVLAGIEGRVCVAGLNTPVQTVVSGDVAAVEAVRERFAVLGRRTRRLEVSHAFHSAHMDSMLAEFGTVVADLDFAKPELTVVSSVTGERVSAGEWSDPAYWVRQVREPVRFLDAVRAVEAEGVGRYLECGPGAVLSVMAAGCVAEDSAGRFVASLPLRKGETDEARALLRTVGALHAAGQPVDWDAVLPATATLAELPTYVFQRERYWLEVSSGRSGDVRAAGLESAGHPWLGAGLSLAGADGGEVFTGRLSAGELRWLADHAVFGTVLVPGTGLLEVALAAAERVGAAGVGELTVLEPLVLRGGEAVRIQVRIGEAADHGSDRTVEIHSRPENAPETDWSLHAHGTLLASPSGDDEAVDLTQWPAPGAEPVSLDGYYDGLRALGLEY